ncbi:MAG: antibiotic biosynthesis monooxygenase, partial [candidate division WOR-3 bacterium]
FMFIAINRIFVKDEFKKEWEERFKRRKRLVEKKKGFRKMEVLKPLEGNDYLVVTYWETKEDFLNWVNSEDFKEAHKDSPPSEFFLKQNEFSIYELLYESG